MVGYSFLGDSFIHNSMSVYPDAICPFRSTVAAPTFSPLTDPTVQISTQRVPQARLPALSQGCVISGSNKGWRRRISAYLSHVSRFPRVRRVSHFLQMRRVVR